MVYYHWSMSRFASPSRDRRTLGDVTHVHMGAGDKHQMCVALQCAQGALTDLLIRLEYGSRTKSGSKHGTARRNWRSARRIQHKCVAGMLECCSASNRPSLSLSIVLPPQSSTRPVALSPSVALAQVCLLRCPGFKLVSKKCPICKCRGSLLP